MGKTQFDLVIFDCDGVLIDSEPIINRVLAEALNAVGFPIAYPTIVKHCVGKSLAGCLEAIEASYGKSLPPNFIDRYREIENAAFERELRSIPGIERALNRLKLPKCVASNSSRRRLQLVLNLTGILHHFQDNLYSCYDVERPKPFPDVYLYAAQQMNVKPEKCLVIEDSPIGVEAGFAAGMTVFGYGKGRDRDALVAAGAELVFNDMQQLTELL